MSNTPTGGSNHILIYPFSSTHFHPMLELTRRLLTRGLFVTLVVTPNELSFLQQQLLLLYPPPSFQPLVLPAPQVTDDPTRNWVFANVRAMRDLHYPALLDWFRSHPSPPKAVISDLLLGWTHQLASEFGVPRLVFSPTSALAVSVFNSLWRDLPKKEDPGDEDFSVSLETVPNSPSYPWWQLPPPYVDYKEGDSDSEFYRSCELGNLASWGVVVNSFTELERVYVDHLKEEYGSGRVWAVGPLKPDEEEGSGSQSNEDGVMKWLDQRRNGSVVFVCFGSWVQLTQSQVNGLAEGLERSGVHFVWRVSGPNEGRVEDGGEVVPDGFEDRVADRGYVVNGWAPQVAILKHRAVGAFLSHCGWNSTLEALTAGVLMLTWPITADQFINAKLLVDDLGVAVRVGEGDRVVPGSGELARVLAESLDEARPERVRVKKVRDIALEAVRGGSSHRDVDELAKRMAELN
ncbi:UDP-glucuronosyl/UDP-glucosyltransferase [Trema orientale]|uniref:UDP-glucuronosyl/UDP-glucosyltransferase n=1 Tax=Trema orientale TaxID=63057 RepID=A0A2P5EBR3_TREOI|nr:UDP-glucuronosyl/UDP-glucosyltransferase [Trema orientale]